MKDSNLFSKIDKFFEQIVEEIGNVGIDIKGLVMDHIAYSTCTTKEYESTLPRFKEKGDLLREAIIGKRRVAVIKLTTPIKYKTYMVDVVELIEPKEGQEALSGWEHVEFLVENYDSMLKRYPDLDWDTKDTTRDNFSRLKLTLPSKREVKFLDTPVLESIARE